MYQTGTYLLVHIFSVNMYLVKMKKKTYGPCVDKKYRNKGFSNLLMEFNSHIILQQKLHSFLICFDNVVNFYKKFNWHKINSNMITLMVHSFSTNGMIFNIEILKKKKI